MGCGTRRRARHDPPPRAAELLAGAVTPRDAWLPDDKNYVGITKEHSDGSYEQNKIFSISWTNGLSAAVPCLQAAHRLGMRQSALRPLPALTILCRTLWTRAAACPTRPGTPKTAGAVGAGGSTACTRAGIPAIWSDRRFIIS